MIREDFVRIVLVGHIECDATPKEFGLLGAHSIGSYVSFRAGSRPFLAAYRDGDATIGVVTSNCIVWQAAVTHSGRSTGGSRNFRQGDRMRWYAFPCFPRMTNISAANLSKRGIPPCERAFYCENDGC
jgi:hypothetical protein